MKKPPKTGSTVRGSKTGRPIMVLLDLLGRRWMLRMLWELRDGALTFRGLRERCGGTSPSVLNSRLDEAREAGLLENGPGGYVLTEVGEELLRDLRPLRDWADRWQRGR